MGLGGSWVTLHSEDAYRHLRLLGYSVCVSCRMGLYIAFSYLYVNTLYFGHLIFGLHLGITIYRSHPPRTFWFWYLLLVYLYVELEDIGLQQSLPKTVVYHPGLHKCRSIILQLHHYALLLLDLWYMNSTTLFYYYIKKLILQMLWFIKCRIIISLPLTLPVLSAIMNYVPGDEMYSVLLPEIK